MSYVQELRGERGQYGDGGQSQGGRQEVLPHTREDDQEKVGKYQQIRSESTSGGYNRIVRSFHLHSRFLLVTLDEIDK